MVSPAPAVTAFVALGSNLGDARENILRAFARLQSLSDAPIRRSSLWESAPVDCPPGSPMFLNAVAGFEARADETAHTLLAKLQSMEKEIGRQPKKILNEPRVIDLDLIAFGQQIVKTKDLILPHPRAQVRDFVLWPLSEIAPGFIFPRQLKTVAELLSELHLNENVCRIPKVGRDSVEP
jgi:2-amino-4-hydroxy-6-hydroxymethyldihydropteridine diphosphokinase